MSGDSPNNPGQELGPTVGAVIIVGLIIIGGFYFLFMQAQKTNNIDGPVPDVPLPQAETSA